MIIFLIFHQTTNLYAILLSINAYLTIDRFSLYNFKNIKFPTILSIVI